MISALAFPYDDCAPGEENDPQPPVVGQGQRSEIRGQRSEIRGQRSGVRDQGSEIRKAREVRFVLFQVGKFGLELGVFTQRGWRGERGRGMLRGVPTHPSTEKSRRMGHPASHENPDLGNPVLGYTADLVSGLTARGKSGMLKWSLA
jgi:hypothetical protein